MRARTSVGWGLAWLLCTAAQGQPSTQRRGPSAAQAVAVDRIEADLGVRLRVRWDPVTGCPSSVRFDPAVVVPAAQASSAPAATAWLVAEVSALVDGTAPTTPQPGPWLELLPAHGEGAHRQVELRQRLGDAQVHDSGWFVDFTRRPDGVVVARGLSGRIWRWSELPRALPQLGPPPAEVRAALERTRVVTPEPDGVWKSAWETVEFVDAITVAALRDPHGALLAQRSLDQHGQAEAHVHDTRGGGLRAVPIADLYVDTGGEVAVTDAAGHFPGDVGAIPWGLAGPHERVLVRSGSYPETTDGRLNLTPLTDTPQVVEASVFHHLTRFRRWAQSWMPRAGWDHPVLALVHTQRTINATASPRGMELEGRRFDYVLRFGFGTDEPSVVGHERGHAVLYGLRFVGPTNDEARALHEGYADYLAAAYQGHPRIGQSSLGHAARSLDDHRTYPENLLAENFHQNSLIFSGALWDARQEAGATVDRAALAAVGPALRNATMPEAAERVLELVPPGRAAEALRRSFTAHGLLHAPTEDPVLRLRTRDGRRVTSFYVGAGSSLRQELEAFLPDAPHMVGPSGIQLSLDGPDFVRLADPEDGVIRVDGGTRPARLAGLVVEPGPDDAGSYMVTVTAQHVGGATSSRTFPISVFDGALPYGNREEYDADLVAAVGQKERWSLASLYPPLEGVEEPYAFRLAGSIPDGVTLLRGDLVATMGPGEEGVHRFQVRAESVNGPRTRQRILTLNVTLTVTSDVVGPASIAIYEPVADTASGPPPPYADRPQIPPGQGVTVVSGGVASLDLRGWVEGEPQPGLQFRVEPADLATVYTTLGNGTLLLHPRRQEEAETRLITLTLIDRHYEVLATRSLPVHILPNALPLAPDAPLPERRGLLDLLRGRR